MQVVKLHGSQWSLLASQSMPLQYDLTSTLKRTARPLVGKHGFEVVCACRGHVCSPLAGRVPLPCVHFRGSHAAGVGPGSPLRYTGFPFNGCFLSMDPDCIITARQHKAIGAVRCNLLVAMNYASTSVTDPQRIWVCYGVGSLAQATSPCF